MYSDKEILKGLKTGDNSVLEYLYSKYRDPIIDFVVKNSGSEEEAIDVLQDSVINIYRKILKEDLVLYKDFNSYFSTAYRNNWRAVLKIKNQRIFTDEFPEDLIFEEFDYYNEYEFNRHQSYTTKQLKELGVDCQQVIEQYYLQNKTMNEIAYLMNYGNAQIAKNKRYRCVEYLKELLKNHINF
ncbi:MAG: hypothetical protein A2033_19160 [Bacteroidetes bacterium GWA2_31_9]|nr:MAG: hypothetical protein A2033_19160 [Bacteroidetes bacterium GWA2_31_9]